MASRIEIAPRQNVLGRKDLNQFVPADAGHVLIDFKHDILKVVALALVEANHLNALHLLRQGAIELKIEPVRFDKSAQAFKPRDAHRRRNFAHLAVGANKRDLVDAGKAEILHQPDLPREFVVIRRNRAAFE